MVDFLFFRKLLPRNGCCLFLSTSCCCHLLHSIIAKPALQINNTATFLNNIMSFQSSLRLKVDVSQASGLASLDLDDEKEK